jgi:hypothetical protein
LLLVFRVWRVVGDRLNLDMRGSGIKPKHERDGWF